MLVRIKSYILNLRILLPILCCSWDIIYLEYPMVLGEKSMSFLPSKTLF